MKLHYKEYGEKNSNLMVFIHGGGVSGWMWDKQLEYFSSKYYCIIPDLPEHGISKDGTHFTIGDAAVKINELIEELVEGKQVIAIGFSLGAQVLLTMLSKKPKLINYAMINSALVKPVPLAETLIKSMMFAYPLIRYKAFSKIQAKSMYIDENYHNTYYDESCQINKDTFFRIMSENLAFKIPDNFESVETKLLVTVGEKERNIMKKSLGEIIKKNLNCKGVIIPNIGHGFSLAKPNQFNKMLESWIEKDIICNEVKEMN